MMSLADRLRAYAELGRISNLPTTITNVLVGAAAGATSLAITPPTGPGLTPYAVPTGVPLDWLRIAAAWLAVACFYVAGMALNDVADVALDRVDNPQRPIPSQRISRAAALRFAVIALLAGLVIVLALSMAALISAAVLVALLLAYNLLHLKFAGSVALMGLCRGMVYVIAATAMTWPVDWFTLGILAGAMTLYTICFSVIARSETQKQLDLRKWLGILIPLIVAIPVVLIRPAEWIWTILALVIVLPWLSRAAPLVFASPPRTRQAVLTWLSGICLVDALYLSLLNQPAAMFIAIGAFLVTLLAHRHVAGT